MYRPLRKTDIVIEHSFILYLEDLSYENLLKEASKILQSRWNDHKGSVVWDSYKEGIALFSSDTELTVLNKRILLIEMIELLKEYFPYEFNKVGWYDRECAVARR